MLRQSREALIRRGACKAPRAALPVAPEAEGLEPQDGREEQSLLPRAYSVVLELNDAGPVQRRLRASQHLAVMSLRTVRRRANINTSIAWSMLID